jgi:hypothetical protein
MVQGLLSLETVNISARGDWLGGGGFPLIGHKADR